MGHQWSPAEDEWLKQSRSYEHYCVLAGNEAREKGQAQNRRRRIQDNLSAADKLPRWSAGEIPDGAEESTTQSAVFEDEPFGFRDREEDEDVRDYWEAQKKAIAAHQRRLDKRSNSVIPYTTEDPDQPFGIFFFGDTHIGSNGILAERMEADFELMRQACETLGARLVFMGDALENAKINGKAAPAMYDQGIPPDPQRDVAELLFSPLAPYFLAFLEGNHDHRDANSSGIGWMREFAQKLSVPYVSEAGCAIHLTHGFQRYTIFARHDWRGKSQINKSNSLRRFWQEYPEWENADVGVLAHLHEALLEEVQMQGRRVYWMRSASWKVYDSYAARGGFTPEVGVASAIFWPNQRRISASIDLEEGIDRLEAARRQYRRAA